VPAAPPTVLLSLVACQPVYVLVQEIKDLCATWTASSHLSQEVWCACVHPCVCVCVVHILQRQSCGEKMDSDIDILKIAIK
jgi:hypothetical protein